MEAHNGLQFVIRASTNPKIRAIVVGDRTDRDGKTDPAVYRRSTRVWHILASSAGYVLVTRQWGLPGDIPVPGDYDGDNRADLTVYRPSLGRWYVLTSSSSQTSSREFVWGLDGDVPVPGNYDGDGSSDVAVYRPSTGVWYLLHSSSNFTTTVSRQWGLPGDVTAPSDYDGDGRTDLAVYRPSTGTWFIAQSTSGYAPGLTVQWGLSSDTPVPNAPIVHALAVRSTLATLVRTSDFDGDHQSDLTVYRPSVACGFGTFFCRPQTSLRPIHGNGETLAICP